MKIRYVEHKDIDFKRWDMGINNASNSLPYAYSWYLNVVSPCWDALVNDDYTTLMPLTWKKKLGFYYIYQPFFAQQLGIFSAHTINPAMVRDFLEAIPRRFRYFDFYLNENNPISALPAGLAVERVNYLLPLDKPYAQIYKSYRKGMKENITKKNTEKTTDIYDLAITGKVVDLYEATISHKIANLLPPHYAMLRLLALACAERDMAECMGIYNESNKLTCGLFLIKSHNRLINLISAVDEEGRKNRLLPYLLNSVIARYAASPYTLDFEGSMVPSIANFFQGFGAQAAYYWHITDNKLPFPVNLLKK